ncbi:protein-export chaperone SecB [Elongatibacter sediminis]|uniref:Protein-export protein SecB n=1 Tax=Elongatibacter sediminis TaxID=3119006 RepID=A0AAW9RFA4_9GAMM
MAEEQTEAPAMSPEDMAAAQFQIQKLYCKDVSFELPNAPEIFQEQGQADVKMSLAQRVDDIGDNLHEIVLTVTVTASMGEKTAYLAEVAQAGIFLISGFNDQTKHAVMNTMCPNALFPYARRAISALVGEGGFPPLTLQPVNFEQLYAQRMQELAGQQGAGGNGQDDAGGVPAEFTTEN